MKIAIVKLSAMGDIVHAMVALQLIKARRPDVVIDWVVEQGLMGILADNPDINRILTVNLKALKHNKRQVFAQIRQLKTYAAQNYDYVIDAQGLLKSAIVAKLLGRHTIGFSKNSIREKFAANLYSQTVDIDYAENVIWRNVKVLCEPLGIQVTKNDLANKAPFLCYQPLSFQDTPMAHGRKNIILVLGASRPNKVYPVERFVELVTALDRDFGAHCVLIWGNEQELAAAQYVAQHAPQTTISPKLSLNDLKALLAQADLVIGGDTGPTHCAWALNVPSITIFGNTPEYRNTWISDINRVVKSSSNVDPLRLDASDFSIREIPVQAILEQAKDLLALKSINKDLNPTFVSECQ
jgi:heptosyltransferase-1